MKAIVTGAAGFAGSHAIEWFCRETGWDIVAVDSYRHKGDHGRLTRMDPHRVRFLKMDLSSPIPGRFLKEFVDADYIINYASDSHVDRSISDPRQVWENNTGLILNILEVARECTKLRAFFQISTDEVYGPAPAGHAHAEWSPMLPSNVYSASKAAQEAICVAYWRTWGIPVVITNAMNMIGEMQDSEKFLPMVIGRILNGHDVTIHGSENQVGTRFYTHAKNLASAILFLSKRGDPASFANGAKMPDRWNIVGEREVGNLEMARMVSEIVGLPLSYRFVASNLARPGHDLRYALDPAKMKAAGWTAPISFEEALKNTIGWYLQNRSWL
jgi:dTDP-glucose 4,6-dehydratase